MRHPILFNSPGSGRWLVSQATPMTFAVAGHQYIGFMAGGHHFMGTPTGDYVLAYGLEKP